MTRMLRPGMCLTLLVCAFMTALAQQAAEQRAALADPAVALDSKGGAAIEGRLLTTMLNGSPEFPVNNVRIVLKNVTNASFTYVSGWATFYDQAAVRCGEGQFALNALAANESAGTDAPGLRLHCTPVTWRLVATNLVSRANEIAAPSEGTAAAERPVPKNFVISIDGEEHPIQLNNPLELKLGDRTSKIVIRPAP